MNNLLSNIFDVLGQTLVFTQRVFVSPAARLFSHKQKSGAPTHIEMASEAYNLKEFVSNHIILAPGASELELGATVRAPLPGDCG